MYVHILILIILFLMAAINHKSMSIKVPLVTADKHQSILLSILKAIGLNELNNKTE